MKKKSTLLWIITFICIGITVALWFVTNRSNPEYEEVQATIISSETKTRKILGKRLTYYEVRVDYNGRSYMLENVHGSAAYAPGRSTTALLSEGKLYANIEGIKTSTPLSTVYFIFLFGSFGMIALSFCSMGKARNNNS